MTKIELQYEKHVKQLIWVNKENEMKHIKYRGYKIYFGITKHRIFVTGKGISCLQFWYNLNICKEYIDFVIKFDLGRAK